jgi:hypothetical protein
MSKRFVFIVTFLLLLGISGSAAVRQTIQFVKGSHSAVINNSVIRGEVDRYELIAKAGQTMTVEITAEEENAAFTIYLPGWVEKTEDDMTFIEGPTLSGAGEGEDAVTCEGKLPAGGKYLIEVGGTRGNASYTLKITIL